MKINTALLFLFCSVFLASCNDNKCDCIAPPFETNLQGQWKWVKTTTPTKTITAEAAGINRTINFFNDGRSDLVTFYQSDSLKSTLVRSREGASADKKNLIYLMKFNPDGYIKFYMKDYSLLETSELMKDYTEKADTIRHFYQYIGQARR
ncbi:hypothetical protein ACFP1I_06655 [Dyadobacter subterraneus]|uniref:Lipocalin-like domain-containing protein n=1 Tax=Dyadobacter subterraneus TaxID=2773304 RepID=A0ABR9WFA7_9BACT|nr:hypothetical protein [Dyadobacter subterraneus]MBE9464189.1 hypothetical protein [Dyadobacter subterraneus]